MKWYRDNVVRCKGRITALEFLLVSRLSPEFCPEFSVIGPFQVIIRTNRFFLDHLQIPFIYLFFCRRVGLDSATLDFDDVAQEAVLVD